MSESFTNDRIKFKKHGVQKNFILNAKKLLDLTWNEFSQKLKINPRTLTNWKSEKFHMSYNGARIISKLTKIPIPQSHSIIDWNVHLQNAGRVGGKNKLAMYGNVGGDEINRKNRWKVWWQEIGQYKEDALHVRSLKKIKIPQKGKALAEFVGILLGDGSITPYHVSITLSSEERQYIQYVQGVVKELFGVVPKIYKHKHSKAVDIVVNRRLLVDFCQKVGFKMGNKVKHQVDIPEWIKENKIFSRECLRGLVDTDGCFFQHSYLAGDKRYSYLKIAFTSASYPLMSSVAKILINFGFNVRISKNQRDVRIDGVKYVQKYIKEIGTHNHKHLEKIKKWKVAGAVNGTVC